MMCQMIGWPPISTMGFGLVSVSSERRVPSPPARMTTFMRPDMLPAGPGISCGGGGGSPGRSPFPFPALLFLLAGAISVLAAPDRRAALGLYRAYLIEPVVFFLVLSQTVRTAERALLVALGFGVGAIALAIPNAFLVLDGIL